MKLTSEQLVPWFNHRVYPMVAWVLVHFVLGALFVMAYGIAGHGSGIPLFIISVAETLGVLLFVMSTIDDMKRLSEDMAEDFRSTRFGSSFVGFGVFALIFSILIIAVPVAHGLLFL
ncbi:MAG: hypothetical protein HN760_04015 [Microbacteriaceae bacterium]|jgi:asparagine N-glycosylation enzyme membrane subunit Stt3|nr:hypothetical protein [Microbacteriaceae bacterium]